ncbi:MAG TPA: LysR family transcriptional regulator [Aliidongia sp.]|uniref:LysR family transcriptional regulator n=1 Tax=Aliidongia sp. TaxID=1914230 RepID=UPI002DDCDBC2|nr:LysR family transcriptional regulator [Aliidongia sp.]HEV2675688.1 LysR family transcriptional regulator [Aliidongia sp.]
MGRFEEMQAFVRTAEARSFTAAAQRLGLSKSIVSQRVADLEARLGVRLINRTTRRLSLTEAGAGFLTGAERALGEAAEAEERATRHGTELRGALRIAAPLSFALMHLQPAIFEFMAAHPALEVHIDLDDRHLDLVAGGWDMALRIGRLPDSSLIARRLAPSLTICCATQDYLDRHGTPTRPEQLERHECVLYSGSHRPDSWPFLIDGEWVPVNVRGRLVTNNGDLILAAVLAGQGVAILPSFLVGCPIARGQLVRVLADWPTKDGAIHAVYPPTRNLAARVRLFTDFLAERIGKEPYWDQGLAPAATPSKKSMPD